jgi:Domain of unknown function (DUF4136)
MKKNQLFTVAIILFLTACFSPAANIYQSEKTKGVDFKTYKTYAFLHTNDTAYTKLADKEKVERALAAAVRQELTKHGMVLDSAKPDCLFTYTLVLNKTYQVGESPNPVYAPQSNVGPLPGQYNMYYYVPQSTAYYNPDLYQGSMQVATFRDGSLVIDMIDTKDKKIVWRTSAQGKVDERDRKGIRPTIDQIVPAMFKKFPVN